ncbi:MULTISPECIES: phosphodiesterase [unclassified Rathayibacter]|uniref:phosphodiesterase n=1 Tax=unclassified Rathayibacter TaxID=2609250 RepID=UPI000F4B584D|nr:MULTISPECIES: phosphodiesterase [unclassified Rathayibacter]ROP48273.1 calcineurin-like phosphoesterase family protein [Rathayibacter sp. PhB186]ROS49103.1 calcineurin-like phosphoesterase family protein [Rathayibacter sp. PhB185]
MGDETTTRTQPEHPQLGYFRAADRVLAHLSDTHFLAEGAPLYGRVDTVSRLEQAVARLVERGGRLDAIVVTGDVADRGEEDAYRRVKDVLDPMGERFDCPIVWVMGNHDERGAFRRVLLDQEAGDAPIDTPIDQVVDLGGLRLIALDSAVPGYHHGALTGEQLEALRAELATPAPLGTILALHHPPLPTPLGAMTVLELRGMDRLEEVVRGTDVRAILGGHLHYPTAATFAGVPVFVAGATSYTMDLGAPERELAGIDGAQSFSLVHVHPETVVTSLVPSATAPIATRFGTDLIEKLESLDEQGRIDLWSRMPGTDG